MLGRRFFGGGFAGGMGGALLGAAVLAVVGTGCGNDGPSEPEVLLDFPDAVPGDIVGLVAIDDGESQTVEWIDRLDGTVHHMSLDSDSADIIATIPVGNDGEQRGLLGQVVIDGRRFASWTTPEAFELVVGEVLDDGSTRLVWHAGEASSGAIGGVLRELDGQILLGLGRNTEWDRESGVGGAMLLLDPDDAVDQEPTELSVGYTNPWAFTVTESGEVWVADNAAGPDPDDDGVDDIERIGRADLVADRSDMARINEAGRAPSSMVELPDGRLGICGFLDNELRAYEVVDSDLGERTALDRAGTIMPCITSAAIFDDGTIVTIALGDPGTALVVLKP